MRDEDSDIFSTGNFLIHRMRSALATGGTSVVLAHGCRRFRRFAPVAAGTLLGAFLSIGCPATLSGQATPGSDARAPTAIRDSAALAAAAWLAGCWEASSPGGQNVAEEQWMAPRGGLMLGMSRSIREGEARGYELLLIRVDDGGLVYHAVPSDQAPTDFAARSIEKGRLEFVNPEHDFPRKIAYTRLGEDRIQAAVFAETDAAEPAFVLPYRRTACAGG